MGSLTEHLAEAWKQVENRCRSHGRPERLFRVEAGKTALLVIDMQRAWMEPGWGWGELFMKARDIVHNINRLAKVCRLRGVPVIWIKSVYKRDGSDAGLWPLFRPKSFNGDKLTPLEGLSDPRGTELWSELDVDEEKDLVIVKKRFSAFIKGSSRLDAVLRKMGINTIIITGIVSNVCCESTARDAMMLGYRVIFVSDATASPNELLHQTTLMNMKLIFADVATTSDVVSELNG
ncbi:MAG: isochorismatase family cysteine hydrolase [Nitrososphaerales archaeon]